MEFHLVAALLLLSLVSGSLAGEDATKNHRLEKRQDDSFFFGGWRPVHQAASTAYFHRSPSGRYHDLISALPGSLDAASRYYTHALPSNYYKDIFSYYPRPAIRNLPRKNTPVYMERLKPKRQQPKQGSRGRGGAPEIIDIQNIDLKQIQGLQDLLLQAKELPLTQLNLPGQNGNQYDLLRLAMPSLPQTSYGSRNGNRYNRNKRPQSKGVYGRMPQSYTPSQLPLQFQFIEAPKTKTLVQQIHQKDISIAPLQLPHQIEGVDDILRLKNIQVIEVPVPSMPHSSGKNNQGYGSRNNAYSQLQYQSPSPKSATKVSFPSNTYYTHQTKQSRKQYAPQTESGYSQQQQQMPQIEAELVKLSEDEIQGLLSKLQLVHKNSQEFLKVLPLTQNSHKSEDGQVQLILSLQGNQGEQGEKSSGYEPSSYDENEGRNYNSGETYVAIPQDDSYSPHGSAGNTGGYQIETQAIQHNAAGYQIEEQSNGSPYGQKYQSAEEMQGYGQTAYQQDTKNAGYAGHQDYKQSNYGSTAEQDYKQSNYGSTAQQDYKQSNYGSTAHQPEQYLEIISPQSGNGYRREPVLAVEIQKGQSIEDVIKAIDPATLQRLGAHGKEGLEIEVVEVPVDEYSAESKKAVTYVSSNNATTETPPKKSSESTATTVSQERMTTTSLKKKAKS